MKYSRNTFDSEERLAELSQKRCSPSQSNEVQTLQHGDFHFNNLLFKKTDSGMKVRNLDCFQGTIADPRQTNTRQDKP